MIRPHSIDHRVRRRGAAKRPSARLLRALDKMKHACAVIGISVDELLAKPAADVLVFARDHHIAVRDIRDICSLLIERLDALDLEFAAAESLLRN